MKWLAVAASAASLVLLTGCGAAGAPEPGSTVPAAAAATAVAGQAVDVTGAAWEHVHNIAFDGDALLLGTHQGLYRQEPGRQPALLSEAPFDVMGLTYDGERWLASGHPAAGEELPADLGLRSSPDGRTWGSVSLTGEVDFHRLAAAGTTVLGVAAHGGTLLRSGDSGRSWITLQNPGVFDIAIDPADASRVIATTQTGPALSQDGGSSWTPLAGAPLVAFISWTPSGLLALSPDGTVVASADSGATWQTRGSVGGQPAALAASGVKIAALVGDRVLQSDDGGRTFVARISGLGH